MISDERKAWLLEPETQKVVREILGEHKRICDAIIQRAKTGPYDMAVTNHEGGKLEAMHAILRIMGQEQ